MEQPNVFGTDYPGDMFKTEQPLSGINQTEQPIVLTLKEAKEVSGGGIVRRARRGASRRTEIIRRFFENGLPGSPAGA